MKEIKFKRQTQEFMAKINSSNDEGELFVLVAKNI